MKGITPCIWFDDQGEEAATFWTSIFKDSKINAVTHYPSDAPSKQAGEVLTVEFEIAGQPFTALNGGPEFKPNEAISFQVNCENQDEIDHYWDALTADGGEEGPCGWVKDKYGVSWQIVPVEFIDMWNNPDQKKVAAAFGAMMQMKKLDIAELKRAYDSAGSSE